MLPGLWKKELINIQDEIINKHTEVDWVNETAQQLIRDFAMLQIELEFQPLKNDKYLDLFQQAIDMIGKLYTHNYPVFLNLLYRIDLDEGRLHELISATAPPML